MYSIHIQFIDSEIGQKFQNHCHRLGIRCSKVTWSDEPRFHVATDDETFYERLTRFIEEQDFLQRV